MIFQVLKATRDNPANNDFVKTCQNYLDKLNIQLTFEELGKMSKWSVKKLVNLKIADAAFKYLSEIQVKQSKISHIKYDELCIQEYLLDGNRNTEVSKFIYKARSMTLDIKTQKSWKYNDKLCIGCGVNYETGEEILLCTGLKTERVPQTVFYDLLFIGKTREMSEVAKILMKRLKLRDKLMDEEE